MSLVTVEKIKERIINAVKEVVERQKLKADVDDDFCPGTLIKSLTLLVITGRVGKALEAALPENYYIFYDKKNNKQLSIKDSADKLLKAIQKHGK